MVCKTRAARWFSHDPQDINLLFGALVMVLKSVCCATIQPWPASHPRVVQRFNHGLQDISLLYGGLRIQLAAWCLSNKPSPGVCLGDGQTEAEGVPSQGGRGDALLRRMLPYLTSESKIQRAYVIRRFRYIYRNLRKHLIMVLLSADLLKSRVQDGPPSQCGGPASVAQRQSVGLWIERSRVRNSLVPSGFSLRQGN